MARKLKYDALTLFFPVLFLSVEFAAAKKVAGMCTFDL